jgi:para-nitrobenzyl esterase
MRAATTLTALVAAMLLLAGRAHAEGDLSVRLESGALTGVREGEARVFKGIPYAAPPVGPLRWRPPQPPLAWTGERAADKFGPPCARPTSPMRPASTSASAESRSGAGRACCRAPARIA